MDLHFLGVFQMKLVYLQQREITQHQGIPTKMHVQWGINPQFLVMKKTGVHGLEHDQHASGMVDLSWFTGY
jgi:hypothetical protein